LSAYEELTSSPHSDPELRFTLLGLIVPGTILSILALLPLFLDALTIAREGERAAPSLVGNAGRY
jgi:hypothetical protein